MLVVKIGGAKVINWDFVCEDLASIVKREEVVVVHGASATRDEIAKSLGIPTKTITSPSGVTSVYTNEEALDVFLMVYCGLVNKKLVVRMQMHGINAVGLSGIDGRLWQAKRKDVIYSKENGKTKIIRDNLSGRVEKVNTKLIKLLLKNKYIPVICPPAISFEHQALNTDNDFAAAVMAGALGAERFVILFDQPGLLKDHRDEKTLIAKIKKYELLNYLPYAQGRMKRKILGAKKATELGVKKVFFSDGRVKKPISNALLGRGTVIS